MSNLILTSSHSQLALVGGDSQNTGVNTWKVTVKHGTQAGVGVSVSGAGAWAQLTGDMSFKIRHLDDSQT